jgi:GTPase SAR1 family protein
VRALARLPSARPFLGAIVRWTGLLQTVFRVAVLYPVYWTVRALLGRESVPGELLASVFVPFFLYSLLRQILIGATQQITRGRPALIPLSKETRERVLSTYRRLGLVFAWAAVIDSLALLAVGPGRIVTLVDGLAATWIAVWAAWATLTWRTSLAQAWQARVSARPESFEATVARWMEASRFGFVLSPIAALRVSIAFVSGVVAGRLSGTTLAARLRAMFLRRRSRRATEEGEAFSHRADLPDEYLEEFPLYPLVDDRDAVLVPRDTLVDSICEQITTWRESKTNGSAVLVGQKGIGKTTLAAMVTHRIEDIEVVTHTLRGTLLTDRDLVRVLGKPLGHPDAKTVDELAEALRAGPERIVVIDEAHSAFLRVIGGYRAFDALVSLVNVTGERVFWLLIFNRHTWSFLNASRSRIHYFRRVIELPAWTSAEIQDLIRKRTNRIGYKLVFGEMLRTDEIGSANELDLIEGSDAYFRLLWESSGGNPRTATCLWLESLTPIGDKVLEVGLFSEATPKALTDLSDDLMFALAAVTQRENLSTEELANTINLPLGFAQFAVRYLRENGLLESKDNGSERVTLAPRYYNQVLRVLRNRHLLLE